MKKNASLFAKRFGAGQWSFLGPGSEKKWYSISEDSPCKGNVSCTSYSRTFGYGKLRTSIWTTLRTMARTPQSTLTCTMRSSEHAAHRLLMHSGHTSHLWLKVSPCVSFHVIHACALVYCLLSGLSSPVFLLPHPVPLPALPDVQLGA